MRRGLLSARRRPDLRRCIAAAGAAAKARPLRQDRPGSSLHATHDAEDPVHGSAGVSTLMRRLPTFIISSRRYSGCDKACCLFATMATTAVGARIGLSFVS